MTESSLYEILGVDKNCSNEELRVAFRKAAKRAHPDRGGDQADMANVNVAYETLVDPQRRLNYDKTGQAKLDDKTRAAEEMICSHVVAWLQAENNEHRDMIVDIEGVLRKLLNEARANKAQGEAVYARLTQKFARFKAKKRSAERVREQIRFQIERVNHQIRQVDRDIARYDLAIKLLAEYEYEPEPWTPSGFVPIGSFFK